MVTSAPCINNGCQLIVTTEILALKCSHSILNVERGEKSLSLMTNPGLLLIWHVSLLAQNGLPPIKIFLVRRRSDQGSSLDIRISNGSQSPKVEAAATTAVVDTVQELTAQCALEECCVMVSTQTHQ